MRAIARRKFTAGSFVSLFAALGMAQVRHDKPQPHMDDALRALGEAKRALSEGSSDKGGHRVKAISLVDQAMAEVRAGIQYDNTH
jgi:hypothetical protein